MLSSLITIIGTTVSLIMLFRQKKSRRDPLRNSEKVYVEVNGEGSLESCHIYLPQKHFVKNMIGAVDKERQQLRELWSKEKHTFMILWKGLTESQKQNLLRTLIDELTSTIEVYSDSQKLLSVLCPKINLAYFLTAPSAERTDTEDSDRVISFLIDAQDKLEIKRYCLPIIVIKVELVDKDVDPNRDAKQDGILAENVDIFLRTLQQLCALKLVQQILMRYKVEPTKSMISRILIKIAPLLIFGALAALTAYLMDRYGVLSSFLIGYKSPFN